VNLFRKEPSWPRKYFPDNLRKLPLIKALKTNCTAKASGVAMITQLKLFLSRYLKDESGTVAIEYAVIAFGIAVVLIAALTQLSTNLGGAWNSVAGGV
jgi:Flp pilus assembly pilin Flp